MALIKLCRPQMETDEVSLLERIRMLEKKLESGMIAVRQTPPGQTDASAGVSEQERMPFSVDWISREARTEMPAVDAAFF